MTKPVEVRRRISVFKGTICKYRFRPSDSGGLRDSRGRSPSSAAGPRARPYSRPPASGSAQQRTCLRDVRSERDTSKAYATLQNHR